MNYISVEKDNPIHYELLTKLMIEYVAETDQHNSATTPKSVILKITGSMIDKLDQNRILRIVSYDGEPVGFCYAKVDKEGDKGLIRPNWGYIMEFYVCPSYRKRGVGREMVNQCEKFFVSQGANAVWLTADAVTGIPFWLACDYRDSNEVSPENNQKIFVKQLNYQQDNFNCRDRET